MIFLECDNDEALLRGLGIPRSRLGHHAGKPRVAKALKITTFAGAIGLVDQDPGAVSHPYLAEFQRIDERPELGLARSKHRTQDKWLIEICPDLEPWLYEAARQKGIRPKEFHLPENHSLLHSHSKAHAAKVRQFVAQLVYCGCPRMKTLGDWLA